MKISSKREGEELDADGYNTSITLQNDELSKDVEFHSSAGSNESVPASHSHIQRSSEVGSGQQQNQSQQVGTKPASNDSGTPNQQTKPTLSSASNPLSVPAQVATGSQPKSTSGCGPMSSHDTQSSHQGTANLSPKPAVNLSSSGGATSKQHLESATGAVEVPSTALGTSNVVQVSTNASKTKTSASNAVQPPPSETTALSK